MEQLVLSAAHSLIEDGHNEAAVVLLSCTFDQVTREYDSWDGGFWTIGLRGYSTQDIRFLLNDAEHELTKEIVRSFNMVLPFNVTFKQFWIGAPLVQVTPALRQSLLELAQGKTITNQGNVREGETFLLWEQLRFRSQAEKVIALELDRKNVFFLPNCLGRLTRLDGIRRNVEADFLVCHEGRWGILEVDGDTYHPPERIATEQERDRFFRQYSIRPVEHYHATRCLSDPKAVVTEFLLLLQRQHAP